MAPPAPSVSVVKMRAVAPQVFSAYVTPLSCPVLPAA